VGNLEYLMVKKLANYPDHLELLGLLNLGRMA
jgi:hypothetical protein